MYLCMYKREIKEKQYVICTYRLNKLLLFFILTQYNQYSRFKVNKYCK